ETLYSFHGAINFATYSLMLKKRLTPTLKLDAVIKLPLRFSQRFTISAYFSSHPVVPETIGIPAFNAFEIFKTAASGEENSMATSASSEFPSEKLLVLLKTIEWPFSKANFSIVFPIFPYPNKAIFIG